MTLGDKIRTKRKQLQMTQADLAQAMGVSKRTILGWENNQTLPRTRKLFEKLSEVLSLPVNYLLTDDTAFIVDTREQYGSRAGRDASALMQEVTGLFAGGELDEEDMDTFMLAVQQAYVDAKRKNRKYTPKKYISDDPS